MPKSREESAERDVEALIASLPQARFDPKTGTVRGIVPGTFSSSWDEFEDVGLQRQWYFVESEYAHMREPPDVDVTPLFQLTPDAERRIVEESVLAAFEYRFANNERVLALEKKVQEVEASLERMTSAIQEGMSTVREAVQAVFDNIKPLRRIAERPNSIWVPITSFENEPFELKKPLAAVVSALEDSFEAGLFEINAYASGDTEYEAVENLKSYLLDLFDHYMDIDEQRLGPEPLKQKRFLFAHIRKN